MLLICLLVLVSIVGTGLLTGVISIDSKDIHSNPTIDNEKSTGNGEGDEEVIIEPEEYSDAEFYQWLYDSDSVLDNYRNSLIDALGTLVWDDINYWAEITNNKITMYIDEIDNFYISVEMDELRDEYREYLIDFQTGSYYAKIGAEDVDSDSLEKATLYIGKANEHAREVERIANELFG